MQYELVRHDSGIGCGAQQKPRCQLFPGMHGLGQGTGCGMWPRSGGFGKTKYWECEYSTNKTLEEDVSNLGMEMRCGVDTKGPVSRCSCGGYWWKPRVWLRHKRKCWG